MMGMVATSSTDFIHAISTDDDTEAMFEDRNEALLANIGDKERKAMVENGSVLGRKWISTIPYTKTQHLTNQQISVALYSRTLLPLFAHCTRCGNRAELGLTETCNISGK
jgi:hypothetical protein